MESTCTIPSKFGILVFHKSKLALLPFTNVLGLISYNLLLYIISEKRKNARFIKTGVALRISGMERPLSSFQIHFPMDKFNPAFAFDTEIYHITKSRRACECYFLLTLTFSCFL